MSTFDNMGLAWYSCRARKKIPCSYLGWTSNGWGKWMPSWIRRVLVAIWNHLICFFTGHDRILAELPPEDRELICPHCCTKLKDPR